MTERGIAQQIVMATTLRRDDRRDVTPRDTSLRARVRRFSRDDAFPTVILLAVIAVLGAYTFSVNTRVLSEFNIGSALTLLAALGFISLGQATVVLTGGIDVSVGPLAGLMVVIASFAIVAGASPAQIVIGLIVMLAVALTVGLINGSLVRFGRFTPVAATLTTFIAVQGISQILASPYTRRHDPARDHGRHRDAGWSDPTRIRRARGRGRAHGIRPAAVACGPVTPRRGLEHESGASHRRAGLEDRRPGLRRRGVLRVPGWRDGDGPDCDRRFLAGHGVHPLERDGRRAWGGRAYSEGGARTSARSSVPR